LDPDLSAGVREVGDNDAAAEAAAPAAVRDPFRRRRPSSWAGDHDDDDAADAGGSFGEVVVSSSLGSDEGIGPTKNKTSRSVKERYRQIDCTGVAGGVRKLFTSHLALDEVRDTINVHLARKKKLNSG
jgi:hypothetical protein